MSSPVRRPAAGGTKAAAIARKTDGRQLRTVKRRAKVHYLVLTEGLTVPQIAERLGCAQGSVRADIAALTKDSTFWLDAEMRAGWGIQVQHMVTSTFQDISRLSAMASLIEKDEKAASQAEEEPPPANPYDPKEEAPLYLEFQRNLTQMEMAKNSRRHHYGEYASIMNAINRNRALIKDFMDDLPLYRKVMELQAWMEQHEQLRPPPLPELPPKE